MGASPQGGKNSITEESLRERRVYEAGLYVAGLTVKSVVAQVNKLAPIKNWGAITISTFWDDMKIQRELESSEVDVNSPAMAALQRQLHLEKMEDTLEKITMLLARPENDVIDPATGKILKHGKKWKPFEYMAALETKHKMEMNIAELNNWNMGRKNPDGFLDSEVTDIYEVTGRVIAQKPAQAQALIGLLRTMQSEMKSSPQAQGGTALNNLDESNTTNIIDV